MKIEEIFDDDYSSLCNNFWVLAILLLLINKKSDTVVNICFKEETEGK